MDNEFSIEISIPTDDNGYILLQCSHCGTFFKSTPADLEDNRLLDIYCPSCGLISGNYITEEVLELAVAMGQNIAMDMIYDEFKKMEKKFKKGPVTFKAGKRSKHEPENPIRSGIEALETATFSCCNRTAKVKPILKITGCYCPFCGVKNYEVE
jgi:hypothetical protein